MAQMEKAHERTASTDHRTSWSWRKIFGRDDSNPNPPASLPEEDAQRPGLARRLSRKVVPGLPRPGTFKRQQSELRDRLEPIKPKQDERRTLSVDRRRAVPGRDASPAVTGSPRLSAPELLETTDTIDSVISPSRAPTATTQEDENQGFVEVSKNSSDVDTQSVSTEALDEMILEELEKRWILNLSMHFRDKSRREKFFVTYAETPTHWRRVTISLDYRNAPQGSLEEELQKTRFQRDKSARIYEAIRESLPDIQFYDTVTNLKLQTENERLHVHVVEDLSEIISYPPVRAISHLSCRRVREEQLVFDSHLSGFVYKVRVDGQVFIKKEIPGPDTVDEFLYEINALHQLSGSHSVIQFGGVVLDNKGEHVKGLLISFAEQGALIDVIYDGEGQISWTRRERWAKQIVQGLSEIHEAGFVQGDFTLSNIVIDGDDNAKIIDINRRGCPVGWEPPEVAALIESNQRISMYIGVKSDLFQLGMVLYALATQHDEPETLRPLSLDFLPTEIPEYFLDLCRRCLDDDPRRRSQAQVLFGLFPEIEENHQPYHQLVPIVVDAVHLDEEPFSHGRAHLSPDGMLSPMLSSGSRSPGSAMHKYAPTDMTDESDYFPRRGRSPPAPHMKLPSEIPLPESSSESGYMDSPTRDTPVENEAIVPTSASQDEHQRTEDMETQPITTPEKPRTTAAAEAPIASYPADLTGVGSAYSTTHFVFPEGGIDDEFTTETLHNDRIVRGHSISCDLSGG
ncbi:Tyrosine-kinase HTK16 [Hyphodiscus hymeniophilus]|uniref:Tyrosine-kinase HTK16 n=1 Tax=Hyphodiscus hymeniophilus TaxID=353542 RepID=A0A9P7AXF9_9HELO|nr:Tyrosine-kinase HTK16 [Hyphodiscus hymeniophilus]